MQTLEFIKELFQDRDYVHFTTLKPPRTDKHSEFLALLEYLDKRKVKYWIVACKSDGDYLHYHGIISYPNDIPQHKFQKVKLAYQRKVNRDLGFCYPLQSVVNFDSVYRYIHGITNKCLTEYYN